MNQEICSHIENDECQFCHLKFESFETLGFDFHFDGYCIYGPKLSNNDSWLNYININLIHNKCYREILNYLYNLFIQYNDIQTFHLYNLFNNLKHTINNNSICYVEYLN
jgi:hypothetical protein